jgi:magnesium transporter
MADNELTPMSELTTGIAAEDVSTRVPVASPSSSVDEVRRELEENRYDSLTHVAVLKDANLAGVLKIEDLFSAPIGSSVGELMDAEPPFVAPSTDQEAAARQVVSHEESALAVVDEEGRFVGFIPPHRLLCVLLWEYEEDMDRLGGLLRDTSQARSASQEPVVRRFRHRVPWLLVGLAGALFATDIVGAFEEQLQDKVLLAFFIPGIVYLADGVGTQTETVVVRGLSVGVGMRQMVRLELLSGLLTGLALSLIFLPITLLRWGDGEVAVAVALSLLAACSVATSIAMTLPWAIRRLGKTRRSAAVLCRP